MRLGKYVALGLMLAMLSGCASNPIAKEFRKEAAPLTVGQVKANPVGTQGTTVIWGGRIINVNPTNGSEMYVMQLPLSKNGKPKMDADTAGRFIALSTGFLDPEAFPPGWLVTVAGRTAGIRTETLQGIKYTYPVLVIQQTHVWRVEPQDYNNYYGYYGGPYWGWYWGPNWWWYGGAFYTYDHFHNHEGFHQHGGFEGHAGASEHGGFEGHAGGGFEGRSGGGFGGGGGHGGR